MFTKKAGFLCVNHNIYAEITNNAGMPGFWNKYLCWNDKDRGQRSDVGSAAI